MTTRKRPRLAFVSSIDPDLKAGWSGTPHYVYHTLRQSMSVTVIKGLMVDNFVRTLRRFLVSTGYDPTREREIARLSSLELNLRLRAHRPDIAFVCAASQLVPYISESIKVVHFSDATFDGMVGYYDEFTRLGRRSRREGSALEQAALDRADIVVFPSEWAADSALTNYGISLHKIVVAPLGANIDKPPPYNMRKPINKQIRLLFCGKSWERKGGPKAVAILNELNRRGMDVRLTVLGCTPPAHDLTPNIDVIGFVDKDTTHGQRLFDAAFSEADFFLMPTTAEAYGLVFAEAAAFGLPSIAFRTGGVSAVVEDGKTGILLPLTAPPSDFANHIQYYASHIDSYNQLRAQSRARYENILNWEKWGNTIAPLLSL